MATLRLKGAKAMATLLNTLPKRITKKILKRILKLAAKPIKVLAKSKVPKDFGVLNKSIGESFLKRTPARTEIIKIGPRTGKRAKFNGWYGHMVEFGTKSHTITADKLVFSIDGNLVFIKEVKIPSISAQPFLGPAFKQASGKALKIMGDQLGPTIEKEVGKLLKRGKL